MRILCAFNGHSEMLSDSTHSQRNTFDQIEARTGSVKHQQILSVIFVRAYDFQSLAMLFINQEVLQVCLKMAVPRTDRETERSSWKPDFTMISLTAKPASLKTRLQPLKSPLLPVPAREMVALILFRRFTKDSLPEFLLAENSDRRWLPLRCSLSTGGVCVESDLI